MGRYEDIHRRSLADPEGFWADAAKAVDWIEPFTKVLDRSKTPFDRWYIGGKLNTAYNC
ncbi:MAG TPA: acetyl-coenzyme A synthetase N-terminal domain-containing protein, partial [Candidatus Polarisedimenticolia bacterium]|nr:acetyl-coenzyme A synthetase N-terminal domain-containing protein [Candidatus Polarisedimenticolia bacterium]